jgi:hypothetical protein
MGMGRAMKLLVQSAMIFFGTLMMAGLVALGEPGAHVVRAEAAGVQVTNLLAESARPWVELTSAQRR